MALARPDPQVPRRGPLLPPRPEGVDRTAPDARRRPSSLARDLAAVGGRRKRVAATRVAGTPPAGDSAAATPGASSAVAMSDRANVSGVDPMRSPTIRAGLQLPMIDAAPVVLPVARVGPGAALVATSQVNLRRCVFRRMTVVGATAGRRSEPAYSVECLFAGPEAPIALGDLTGARAACGTCILPGRFRADED